MTHVFLLLFLHLFINMSTKIWSINFRLCVTNLQPFIEEYTNRRSDLEESEQLNGQVDL